jgi:hypothetical protein
LFPDACRAWRSRAITGKTWAQFKIDFATAHREFRLTNQTAQQSGFHSDNMVIEQGSDDSIQATADATAQLSTATSSDRGTVATLTTTKLNLLINLKRQMLSSLNSRAILRHSRKKSNLYGKDSDRQEPHTTTAIVGLMATK